MIGITLLCCSARVYVDCSIWLVSCLMGRVLITVSHRGRNWPWLHNVLLLSPLKKGGITTSSKAMMLNAKQIALKRDGLLAIRQRLANSRNLVCRQRVWKKQILDYVLITEIKYINQGNFS